MKYIYKTLLATALVFYSATAFAYQFEVDKAHTEIRFKVQHIFSTVSGSFSDFEGNIFFDPDNLADSRFDFTVHVKSVDTNNGKRDNHLRSKDFFNEADYPVMTFKSKSITPLTGNRYALEGTMTIKDVAKPMQIEFLFHPEKPHPFDKGKLVAGFETAFEIPRLDFNVGDGKFYKMGVVGKDVAVEISMEALRKK